LAFLSILNVFIKGKARQAKESIGFCLDKREMATRQTKVKSKYFLKIVINNNKNYETKLIQIHKPNVVLILTVKDRLGVCVKKDEKLFLYKKIIVIRLI